MRVQSRRALRFVAASWAVVAAAGPGCSGDGPSTGTSQKDVGDRPDITSDTSAVVDTDSGLPPEDTGVTEDTGGVDIADADVADTEPGGYDVGVELPPVPMGPACSSDDDCEAPTGRCDPLFNVCVECVVGTECGWNRECVDYHCTGPGGQRCLYDWDCLDSPDGHACKPLEMICTECYEDWQCASDEVCEENNCVPGTWQPWCDTTLDCPVDKVCNIAGDCVDCVGTEDCGLDERCLNFRCQPNNAEPGPTPANLLACDSDKDCRDHDSLCNKDGGFCAVSASLCRTDDHCPPEYHCTGNVCRPDRCYPTEGLCTDLCRDYSTPTCTDPSRRIACAENGAAFVDDDLIDCSEPGSRQFCQYGSATYDAVCGPYIRPDVKLACMHAYYRRDFYGTLGAWCACSNAYEPELCVNIPEPQ